MFGFNVNVCESFDNITEVSQQQQFKKYPGLRPLATDVT